VETAINAGQELDGPAQGLFNKKDLRCLAQVLAGIIDVRLAGKSQASNQELGVIYPGAVELNVVGRALRAPPGVNSNRE